MIAEPACSWTRWVGWISTSTRPGGGERVRGTPPRSARRRCSPSTAACRREWRRPCRRRRSRRRRRSGRRAAARARPRRSTTRLSAARLITQLEMTTSTDASGERDLLEVALDELDVLDARRGRVGAGEREHLVGHVEPDRAAAGGDAPGADEHVRARAGAEVEHRLAGVQVGDGGRDAAAERARRPRASRRRPPPRRRARRRSSTSAARSNPSPSRTGRGGVALADGLADVGQLSHADSSSSASGRT